MGDENDAKSTIKVTDRRAFTRDGAKRDPDPAAVEETPHPAKAATAAEGPATPRPSAASEVRGDGFTMEPPLRTAESMAAEDAAFLNLIVSIYQSGCIHLGLAEEEGGLPSDEKVDFEAARGTIEMLLALKRKTLGNLSSEEGRILESLLAELQMTYALKASDA